MLWSGVRPSRSGLHNSKVVTTCTLILGMLTSVVLGLYFALHSGSSTPLHLIREQRLPFLESEELESGKGKKEVEAKHVSYPYMFFHMIFSKASMYSDMLLLGWNSSECSALIDTGWLVID
ncbi:putative serine incorporator/TMS membrane protein [Helianthus anomalus]